jgi:hypothetical protein
MQINENITVDVSASGIPVRFRWRGVTYTIVSTPELWLTRRAWWTEPASVARGGTNGRLDVPVWRVDATPTVTTVDDRDGTFDLAKYDTRFASRVEWMLISARTDSLDERLFA